ncbi:MAG: division/cell wall cluster transcriptional repressor MraZ [Oscillospiraceae bacterium]|jgi:MraZ protein|nr:division/cell wall cluster transcriptional repressor MraZ [Oscillospiraceae bacterium]
MLIGEYEHSLDAKGRVIVPVKFREDLSDIFYITKGIDGCLFVFSKEEWKKLEQKIITMSIFKSRGIQRFFFSGAAQIVADANGRILIPQPLRNFASLKKDVIFLGTITRVEIWDKLRWKKASDSLTDESIKQAMSLMDI